MSVPFGQRPASQRAGILCNDTRFQAFVAARNGFAVIDAATAAIFLRGWCGIMSRRELDTDPFARTAFDTLLTEFDAWTGRIGKPRRKETQP